MPAGRSSPSSNPQNTDRNAIKIDDELVDGENIKEPLDTSNTFSTNTKITSIINSLPLDHHQSPPKPKTPILKKPQRNVESVEESTTSPYVPVYKHTFGGTFKAKCVNIPSKSLADPKNCQDIDSSNNDIPFQLSNETENSSLNLSTSESIQEESERDDEEGEQAFEYTDDDLDEALFAEHDNSQQQELESKESTEEDPITPVNTPKNLEATFEMASVTGEGHYMPMTPKKSLLSSSASASETSILAMDILNSIKNSTEIPEESPYIEMTHGITDPSDKNNSSAYEIVMVSNKKDFSEPLYMELSQDTSENVKNVNKIVNDGKTTIKKSTLKRQSDKSGNRKSKRNDLPDILKQSQQSYMKSDSSDADDEASKDLSMKSRSRFSLSDTFRPASYYLGASTSSSNHKNSPLAECLDSSDSEIVSPPPIPTSPPPMEDLNNTEEVFSSENFDTIKRMKDIKVSSSENIHQRTLSTSSNPLSESSMVKILDNARNSRLSLPEHLYKQQAGGSNSYLNLSKNIKLFSTASNCSINTDDGSNTSSDFDLYNKIKLQSPSISADSLNQSQLSLTEPIERKSRPRPLSDDSLFKFEEAAANNNLDQYLDKLESSDLYLYTSSNEQTNWMKENLKKIPPTNEPYVPLQHYENMNLADEARKITKKSSNQSIMYYDSLEDVSNKPTTSSEVALHPLKEKNLSIHDANYETEDLKHQKFPIDVSSIDVDQQSSTTLFELTQPSHSRQNSNLSDSVPYYYSDLMSQMQAQSNPQPGPSGINQKLNNQREIPGSSKKNSMYISHIHNLINSGNKQQLTSILSSAAEKDQTIDSRNIYESGSGRLNKYIDKQETTISFANKIYYHEKPSNIDVIPSPSIGDLMYSPSTSGKSEGSRKNSECDEMWEEDAIWRESLRRVSQRHARSLDDLDRIGNLSPANVTAKASRISDADRQWGIVKAPPAPPLSTASSEEKYERRERRSSSRLSREVTYVNDGLSPQYQRTLTKKKNIETSASPGTSMCKVDNDENDVYVQLACSNDPNSDVYEILREDVQNKNSSTYSSSTFDIDRENIRQWDLMSSGLVKTTGNVLKGSLVPNSASSSAPSTSKPPLPVKTHTMDSINGNTSRH